MIYVQFLFFHQNPIKLQFQHEKLVKKILNDNESNPDTCILKYPSLVDVPVNEFKTEGYIAMAFLHLFPTGKGDLRSPRQKNVSPRQYFQYLLSYKDNRFRTDPRFLFFATNSLMRWQAIDNGKIC